MAIRVFSMYTSDLYKEQAEKMAATAQFYGLQTKLIARPHLETWWQNVNQKSQVVLEMIEKYPDDYLVWTDADCRYVGDPVLFRKLGDYDLAMFHATTNYFSSAVLWLNGKRALPYVARWAENVANHPEYEDDIYNLRAAIMAERNRKVYHLPPAYCWDPREMKSMFPKAQPVIIHAPVGVHDYPVPR
jgi:hypothetical protein